MSCGGDAGAGDGGRAEWQRIYDRVEALASGRTRRGALNGIQHEFWDARDKISQARLHQAELSRSRWEAAYKELLPVDNPKLAELLECDLEDSRTCEALLDIENSELLVQLNAVGTCVDLNENNADHEHTSGDLISELKKLKQAYETLCSNKDKEATAAGQKLQQNKKELQVAAQKKDDEIGRLQAEASASKKKILVLEGDIQKLKVGQTETRKRKFACLSMMKIRVRVHDGMNRCHTLEVVESDLIYNVKAKLKAEVLFIDDAIIEYDNKPLADSCALKELHIQEGTQFEVRYPNLVFVKTPTGKTLRFSIDDHFSDTTIYSLKEKIADEIRLAPDKQNLFFQGKRLKDDHTFADCHIQHGSILLVLLRLHVDLNQIFVRMTGKTMRFLIDDHFSDTTIYSLKEKIAEKSGVAPDVQRLYYFGKWLEDDRTFAECNIQPGSALHLMLKLHVVNPRKKGKRNSRLTRP